MPSLIIFDLDGTLLDGSRIDTDRCFVPVFEKAFGSGNLSEDWSTYGEPTSAGILDEISRTYRRRSPTTGEINSIQDRLERAMRESFLEGSDQIGVTQGARECLADLAKNPDWRLAIATGNWRGEAAIKLESAGLDLGDLPMATSDDAMARREILPLAVKRASERYGIAGWERMVYVGDGIWDVRAARENGIRFLGIGAGERADRLRAEGAREVLPDFGNAEAVLRALQDAIIPG